MAGARFRVGFLAAADVVCISAVWALTVWGYRLFGGQYDPALYFRFWPVVAAFVTVNVIFGLYHGNILYPSAPLSPVEELRRLVDSAVLALPLRTVVRQAMRKLDIGQIAVVTAGCFDREGLTLFAP